MTTQPAFSKLPCTTYSAYGSGCIFYTMSAGIMMMYLLVFLQDILHIESDLAGYIIFWAQIVEAITTPPLAIKSDNISSGCCRYSKWKSLHLIGSISVVITCPLIFNSYINLENAQTWGKFIYYTGLLIIFNINQTLSKLSQLALIPVLSSTDSDKIALSAVRNGVSVGTSLFLFLTTWLVLKTNPLGAKNHTPNHSQDFLIVAVINSAVGLVATIIFQIGIKEPGSGISADSKDYGTITENNNESKEFAMDWKSWFKEVQFYQITVLFTAGKLCERLIITYLPMYLTQSLFMSMEFIAIIPLVLYSSSMIFTFPIQKMNQHYGRKITFCLGPAIVFISSIWILLGYGLNQKTVYVLAALMGVHHAVISVTVLALASDLIGNHKNTSGFVYGILCFTDKVSYGSAVLLLQKLFPCSTSQCCDACVSFYKYIMAFAPGALSSIAVIVLLTLIPTTIGKLRQEKLSDDFKIQQDDKKVLQDD